MEIGDSLDLTNLTFGCSESRSTSDGGGRQPVSPSSFSKCQYGALPFRDVSAWPFQIHAHDISTAQYMRC